MLDTEPGSRATAKSALRMLPGTEKVSFPTPGAVVDLDRIDAAFPAPAQKKKANGKEFTPTRACDILDAAHPFTARAAESYFRRSKSAQAVGAEGAAACAMLAAKSFEFESHHPSELYDAYPALGQVYTIYSITAESCVHACARACVRTKNSKTLFWFGGGGCVCFV